MRIIASCYCCILSTSVPAEENSGGEEEDNDGGRDDSVEIVERDQQVGAGLLVPA